MKGFLRWTWGVVFVCLLAGGVLTALPQQAAAYKAEYKLLSLIHI